MNLMDAHAPKLKLGENEKVQAQPHKRFPPIASEYLPSSAWMSPPAKQA